MAKRDDVFPSRFLKAADLGGKPVVATIESAPLEVLKNGKGEDTKTVLHFRKTQKVLPLNRVNWDSVADLTGKDDTDDWPGHVIELYPTTTEMKGEVVNCIRIRAPAQAELKPARLAKPAKAKQQEPEGTLADEMDDEIPFSRRGESESGRKALSPPSPKPISYGGTPDDASQEAALSSWGTRSHIARRSYRRRPETMCRQFICSLSIPETAACSPMESIS